MEIDRYFDVSDDQLIFSRQQSSDFAKLVAGDFNPLHDTDAKRFCVPGDLLFAVCLYRGGVFESMTFDFLNMVDAGVALSTVQRDAGTVLSDAREREYLTLQTRGAHSRNAELINGLAQAYVQFSGQTFPYLLVDLMRNHDVMINPSRPLVIYKSMQLTISSLQAENIALEFSGAQLLLDGKKATVELNFDIHSASQMIGRGQKQMVLGGLRAFDEEAMASLVDEYQSVKDRYNKTQN